MATAKKSTELAPVENFALTTAYDGLDPELAAELKDQMDDLDDESGINCRTIKIPSGGSPAFTVQGDEDGDEDYPKDIEGVIVFTHRMNGYWPNAFGSSTNPEDKIPVCSSMDGKSGLNIRTGEVCECDRSMDISIHALREEGDATRMAARARLARICAGSTSCAATTRTSISLRCRPRASRK